MKVNKVYPQNDEILSILKNFPNGANIDEIRLAHNSEIKIRTLQRRLAKLSEQSAIIISGNARATLYKLPAVNRVASAEVRRPAILIPISKESEQVRSLVTALIQQRKPIGYQRDFLEFYRPNVDSYLTKGERTGLAAIGGTKNDQPAGTYAQQQFYDIAGLGLCLENSPNFLWEVLFLQTLG